MAAGRPPRSAGELRHRIQIQWPLEASDNFGGVTQTPEVLYNSWAAIRPLEGRELERARQIQAETTHMVTMRYRSGVTAKMAVVYQGRELNILYVSNEEERNIWLDLLCKEQPSGG